MAVSPHHRLIRLHEALSRCPNQPDNRAVIMVARVKPAFEVADLKLAALDPGARHGGGQVLPMPGGLEIVTWNTGKAADLKRYGNRSHAEAQFYELMQKPGEPGKIRDFSSIEIEISHSPCTACADMLVGLLRDMKAKGTAGLPAKEKFGWKDAAIPAALRWGELFSTPPQATTGPYLWKLHEEGWQMSAPRLDKNREEAIPENSPPIILL